MKKLLAIILATLILFSVSACGNSKPAPIEDKNEPIIWSDLILGKHLPKPKSELGRILSDYESTLYVVISETSDSEYNTYLSDCKNLGYTIENEIDSKRYSAFNSEGYKLLLQYDDEELEMSIDLDAPHASNEIKWPTNGPAMLLPAPKSNKGEEIINSSTNYSVYISDMTIEDFNDYVATCQDAGFNVDFSKYEEYYSAMNELGCELLITYEGFNTIYINIDAPENGFTITEAPTEVETTAPESEEPTKSENNGEMVDGMRAEFKEAMDSYETFINEYVDFMNRYYASDDILSMMSEYNDMLSEYSEMSEAFNKWDSEDMNDTEFSYYLDVVTRTTNKLLEIEY